MTSQQPPAAAGPEPGEEALTPAPSPSAMKTYHLYYTPSMMNVRLHLSSAAGPCIYYLRTRMLTRKPQLQLRRGATKDAPMVAFARLNSTMPRLLLGSGDYETDSEAAIEWEELRRRDSWLRSSDYEFGTAAGEKRRRTYRWEKDGGKTAASVFACVDEEGTVVARMLSGGAFNWRKGGEIEVAEGVEGGLEALVIVSALALWAVEGSMGRSLVKGHE